MALRVTRGPVAYPSLAPLSEALLLDPYRVTEERVSKRDTWTICLNERKARREAREEAKRKAREEARKKAKARAKREADERARLRRLKREAKDPSSGIKKRKGR